MPTVSEAFLVRRAQAGDRRALDALIERYENAARHVAREYFAPGATHEDLAQSARVGFLKALRLYDRRRGVLFRNYAFMSMEAEVISAVKGANRGKHGPLNDSMTIAQHGEEDATLAPGFVAEPLTALTPERIAESRERFRELCAAVDADLTPRERTALLGIASGLKYEDLGSPKQIDNDLQRARRKLAPLAA